MADSTRSRVRTAPAEPRRFGWAYLPLLLGALLLLVPRPLAVSQSQETSDANAAAGFVQIVLVRHAEKQIEGGSDPALSPQGEARVQALTALFAKAKATRFFASQFRRTQDTVRPWAALAEAEVEVHDARDSAGLVDTLRALPAGTLAVVAGHSNTIPDLASRLGTPLDALNERGWLDDDEYSRLFVVTLPVGQDGASQAALLELSF